MLGVFQVTGNECHCGTRGFCKPCIKLPDEEQNRFVKRKPASHTKGEVLVLVRLGGAGVLLGILGQASGKTNTFSACCVSSLVPLLSVLEAQ